MAKKEKSVKTKEKTSEKAEKVDKIPEKLLAKKESKEEKEAPKKNHLKRNVILWSIVFVILIAILILIFLGVKINFILNDELIIKLNPLDKNLLTIYGQEKNITFSFENYNNFLCNSKCSYRFIDISSNVTIDSEEFVLKSRSNVSRTYSLKPGTYGSGQEIYMFEVECVNIATFTCQTQGEPQIKSSFVTLSYDLSDVEKQSLNSLNKNLNDYLLLLSSLEIRGLQLNYSYANSYNALHNTLFESNLVNLSIGITNISSMINGNVYESQHFLDLWFKGSYDELRNSLNKKIIYLNQTSSSMDSYESFANSTIDYYTDSSSKLKDLINKSAYIGSIEQNYLNENNTYMYNRSLQYEQDLISYKGYFMNKNSTLPEFYLKLSNLSNELSSIITLANFSLFYNSTFYEYLSSDILQINKIGNLTFKSSVTTNISLPSPTCCVLGKCKTCCTTEVCSNDPTLYPVLFIHGHSFNKQNSPETSLNSFTMIERLLQDEGFINAGQLDLQNIDPISNGEYGKSGYPITISGSYYYLNYYDLGTYRITTQKSEHLENYALRLREMISIIKQRTGSNKVNIVAHSMGGLVAREYIRIFGEDSVDKLILIATPNDGISGNTARYCSLFGADVECQDMTTNSVFLKRLNSAQVPSNIKIYAIAGSGCLTNNQDGDGVTTVNSVPLAYAQNFIINGTCLDPLKVSLHQDIINPSKYPAAYNLLKEILKR